MYERTPLRKTLRPIILTRLYASLIKKYRSKMGMPPAVNNLIRDKIFQARVKKFRSRWDIPSGGMGQIEFKKIIEKRYEVERYGYICKKIDKDIDMILNDFELPVKWTAFLHTYLVTGNIVYVFPLHFYKARKKNGEEELYIKIDGDTRREDITDVWDAVEKLKKDLKLKGRNLLKYKQLYHDKHFLERSLVPDEFMLDKISSYEEDNIYKRGRKQELKKYRGDKKKKKGITEVKQLVKAVEKIKRRRKP